MFNKDTYIERRNVLRSKIKSGIILILGNSEVPANYKSNTYPFRQDSTFLYYFGHNQPGYVGVLDVEASTDCLYGDDYTLDDTIWMGAQPTLKEKGEEVGVKSTFPTKELFRTVENAIRSGRKVHFLPPYRDQNKVLLGSLLGLRGDSLNNYVSKQLIKAVVAMREIKSDEEIAQIENACDIGYLMHTTAMQSCQIGVTEQDVTGQLESVANRKGSGVSFLSIVTQNGQYLHNHCHDFKIEPDRLLLIDAGAENHMNYCSDFTRTLPTGGKFTPRQRDIYNIVLDINNFATSLIAPNVSYKSIHLAAARLMVERLSALGLMKGDPDEAVANGAHAMFMPHGLGHQLGLDVHDMEDLGEAYVGYDDHTERSTQFGLAALRMGKNLKKGMVLTVEPGIYFIPALIDKWRAEHINTAFINFRKVEEYIGFGGIRIEDDVLVTDSSNRHLGKKRIPVTIKQIEEAMGDN